MFLMPLLLTANTHPRILLTLLRDVLWEESFGKLDPYITKTFCDKITSFYVGNEVVLSNGVRGVGYLY